MYFCDYGKWNLMVQWSILVADLRLGKEAGFELFKALKAGRTLQPFGEV